MKKKRIILIANSEHVENINHIITSSDIIVRFNLPQIETIYLTGNRTDYLFVANTDDLAGKKFKRKSRFFNFYKKYLNDSKVILPYSDPLIQKIKPFYTKKYYLFLKKTYQNWNNKKFFLFFKQNNIPFDILDDSYYCRACKKIESNSQQIISTGLLAYFYFSSNIQFKDYHIILNGFSFQGWNGHNWSAEKYYILNQQNKGLITLLCK